MRSFSHRLCVGGLLVAAGAQAVYAAGAIPAGDPQARLFVPGALVVAGVALLVRRAPKAMWIPAVAAPVVLAFSAVDPFRLVHLDSFLDFWPSVAALAGTFASWIGAVRALAQRRRGTERSATGAERIAVGAGVVVLVALAGVSAVMTFTRPAIAARPTLRAAGDHWVPDELTVRAHGTTRIVIDNPDWFAHTFTSAELGVDVYLAPRSTRTVAVTPERQKAYPFVCAVTGHEAMVGTIHTR